MANELTSPQDTRQLIAFLRAGALTEVRTPEEAQAIARQCETLRRPAATEWLRGRIGTLLAQYFVSPLPPEMVRAISEDWLAVICANGNPPEWAVTDACRWWIGPDNPQRGKKPQAGDIAKRIKWELGPVAMGEVKVAGFRPQADGQRERRSEAEIKRMADAGNRAVKALQRKAGVK